MFLVLIAFFFSMYAQTMVNSTFNKYSRTGNYRGYTGAEVAAKLLQASGIYDVSIERVGGSLTDHYDPSHKVLRLSDSVYNSTSLSAIGVAAHETGHAVQHQEGYAPLKLRSAMVPLTNISSRLAMPLILIGILLSSVSYNANVIVQLGIILFGVAVLFSLITLPVEFDASNRAVSMLESEGILNSTEIEPVKSVLKAAAMTYVAAAAVAIANLLRLIAIFGGNRRRN